MVVVLGYTSILMQHPVLSRPDVYTITSPYRLCVYVCDPC